MQRKTGGRRVRYRQRKEGGDFRGVGKSGVSSHR